MIRLAALRDPAIRQILPELGKRKNATNQKARRVLGWAPRSSEDAITATAESLLKLGLLKSASDQLKPHESRERFREAPEQIVVTRTDSPTGCVVSPGGIRTFR